MSPSPSFNSYSNSTLAEIAARVVQEFRVIEDGRDVFAANFGEFYCQKREENKLDADDHGDFEFASEGISTVSADEIFHNGKILPIYPTHDVYNNNNNNKTTPPLIMNSCSKIGSSTLLPLRKLFAEEIRQAAVFTATSSSSSSDVDELDGVPAETYCVWRPLKTAEEEGRWKRSSLPKKWKLKDFLQRSFSVGSKDISPPVFISSNNRGISKEEEEEEETIKKSLVGRRNINSGRKNVSNNGKWPPPAAAAGKPTPPPYNRDSGEKRRSYLPYRQQQVGFLAFMNGLGKNLHPF